MSYFTYASTEYDLPHPTLSRHQPRFYIPDRSTYSPAQSSAALHGETLGYHSRHPSALFSTYSGHSTPHRGGGGHHRGLYGSGSRASLTALRHALHSYHYDAPHTPTHPTPCECPDQQHQADCQLAADVIPDRDHDWDPEVFGRIAGEPMEALIDIHRVLYRGMEDPGASSSPLWAEQGQEVKRVVERWFEGDCVYDHPLIRLSSRQSVLTHFALLQLFSTAYLPSFTPSSLLLHARNLTSRLRGAVLGSDDIDHAAPAVRPNKGKSADPVDAWLSTTGPVIHRNNNHDGWWKLWDVSAECRDIGCMECYEGYHIALIDHVVSLTLFPSIVRPHSSDIFSAESDSALSEPPRSFVHSLAASVLREVDFLLHWDLPISTIVEFNEVGKATHVRDVVDVQDVIDTFVPFAKRFSWLSRRVAGLVTSTVGSIALNMIPGHTLVLGDPAQAMEQQRLLEEARMAKLEEVNTEKAFPTDIERPKAPTPTSQSRIPNSLGLEGLGLSMAPDVDGESQDA